MDAAPQRRERLALLVADRGFARVVDLARELRVSEVTVRTDLAALEALHDKLQKAARHKRIVDYYDTNYTIHEAIITLADNRWLAQVIADLRKILRLARLQQLHAPGRLAQSLSEHMAVFAALRARDADGAEAAMRTHLTRQREALRELAQRFATPGLAEGVRWVEVGLQARLVEAPLDLAPVVQGWMQPHAAEQALPPRAWIITDCP